MPDNPCPKVFVLVPVHNRREITRKFMSCLQVQTHPRLQLILVDDGSTDGTDSMVREEMPDAEVLKGNGNLWWSGCMQLAFRNLLQLAPDSEDMILLANDDIEFAPDFIAKAVAALHQKPDALLGARQIDRATNKVLETGVFADLRRFVFRIAESAEQINCLPTRALLVRWKDMKRIGGFHPHLLPHYLADYEYTLRATRRGLRCFTTPDVTIIADLGATGDHDLDEMVGSLLLRRLFSIKTPLNPVYRTTFVLLASPGLWKLINLLHVWLRAFFRIFWQGLLCRPFPRKTALRVSS